jgi:hypothetical protein
MVAFFIPAASDAAQAEEVYEATRKHVGGLKGGPRIRALTWHHDGQARSAEVGSPMPTYYAPNGEQVVAIYDGGPFYLVCSANRGVIHGGPVMAGKEGSQASYFDTE